MLALIWLAQSFALQAMASTARANADDWASATLLPLGEDKSGSLSDDDKDDWYKISVPEEGDVTFTTQADATLRLQNVTLYALDSNGELVHLWYCDMDNHDTNDVKSGTKVGLKAGVYYVRNHHWAGYGGYTFRCDFTACARANDAEPNDDFDHAQTLLVGKTVEGRLGYDYHGSQDKDDWYKINVPEEGDVTFTTQADATLRLQDVTLYALDSNGEPVHLWYCDMDNHDTNEVKSGTKVGLKAGVYYVRNHHWAGYGGYTLRCDFTACARANDAEPNDDSVHAQTLPMGKTVEGRLGYDYHDSQDKDDWYKIEVPEEGDVIFTTQADATLRLQNVTLYALDNNGELVHLWYCEMDNHDTDEVKSGTKVGLKAGVYYVRNHHWAGYGGYTLRCDFTACARANDAEPNDDSDHAQTLPMGKTVEGRLGYDYHASQDKDDWYIINVPEEGDVTFTTQADATLRLQNVTLYALDSNGEPVHLWYCEMDNHDTDEVKSGTKVGLKAGVYYVRNHHWAGYGGYTLRCDFTPCKYGNDEEDNDSYELASTLPLGVTSQGRLGYDYHDSQDKDDWYKIEVPADGTLVFRAHSETTLRISSVTVYRVDDEGEHHMWYYSADSNDKDSTVVSSPVPFAAGTYHVKVHHWAGYGGYSLVCDFVANPYYNGDTEYTEENPYVLQRGVMAYTTLGYPNGKTTRTTSWYQLDVPEGGSTLELMPDTTKSLNIGIVTIFKIEENGGHRWYMDRRVERSYISFDLPESGRYLVKVPKYGDNGYGGLSIGYDLNAAFIATAKGLPVRISYEGRNTVRKGVPSDNIIVLRNMSDKPTDPFLVGIDCTDDIKINKINLSDYYGRFTEDMMYEDICNEDSSIVLFVPILEPFQEYRIRINAEGVGDIAYNRPRFALTTATTVVVLNFVGGVIVDAVGDYVMDASQKFVGYLHEDEAQAYCNVMGMTMQQYRDTAPTSDSMGVTTFKTVVKNGLTAGMALVPGGTIAMKVGGDVSGLAGFITNLRRKMWYWIYKDIGLIKDNPEVADGKIIHSNVVASWDPNEMVGPAGEGAENYISGDTRTIDYTIMFENKAEAGDAAYRVRVSDELDEDVFDLNSVRFGKTSHDGIGYNWKMKRDGNKLSWDIEGIELPPNKVAPEGEGYVTFSVNLKPGLPHGTKISNKATIIFDKNFPIETNTYVNTLDCTVPQTQMEKAYFSTDSTVIVRCNSADTGSGVKTYELYVSKNGGDFQRYGMYLDNWLEFPASRSELDSYDFFVVATDMVGNKEVINPASIALDYTMTNITDVIGSPDSSATFDLMGRKRTEAELPRGIYIKGGKKYYVK